MDVKFLERVLLCKHTVQGPGQRRFVARKHRIDAQCFRVLMNVKLQPLFVSLGWGLPLLN